MQSHFHSFQGQKVTKVMFWCWVTMATTTTLEVKSKFLLRKNALWHAFYYEITQMDLLLLLHAFTRDQTSNTPLQLH